MTKVAAGRPGDLRGSGDVGEWSRREFRSAAPGETRESLATCQVPRGLERRWKG